VVVEKECGLERRRFTESMGWSSSESAAAFGNDGMYLEKKSKSLVISKFRLLGIHTEKHVTF
jgi:hypothetical protein